MTFVQATFVLATFVHIGNISAVTDLKFDTEDPSLVSNGNPGLSQCIQVSYFLQVSAFSECVRVDNTLVIKYLKFKLLREKIVSMSSSLVCSGL